MESVKAYIYRCMNKEIEEKTCIQHYSTIKEIKSHPIVCANGRKKSYQGRLARHPKNKTPCSQTCVEAKNTDLKAGKSRTVVTGS